MAHTSELRWTSVSRTVSDLCTSMVNSLLEAESQYKDLLELYNYVGNDPQALADQLFYEVWSNRVITPNVFDTEANASEVAKAQDLIAAMTSLHELHQAADNQAVVQGDRFSALRRFT